jgi:dimethylargininase
MNRVSTHAQPLKGIAVTREPSASYYKCTLEFNRRREIDVALARRQHAAYVNALRGCGLQVVVLPADERFPDGCFVEDTAVILGDVALITNMGAETRNGEQQPVAECLVQWCELITMRPPATLDGGDVLKVDRQIYVGRSRRTNEAGIDALEDIAKPRGYKVHRVAVEHYLHLKTAVTYAGDNTLLATRQMAQNLRRVADMCPYEIKILPEDSEYAANILLVNGKVIVPDGYPQVIDYFRGCGVSAEEVQMSEFQKGEGGLTCLSILL